MILCFALLTKFFYYLAYKCPLCGDIYYVSSIAFDQPMQASRTFKSATMFLEIVVFRCKLDQ